MLPPILVAKNLKIERGGSTVLEIPDFSLHEGETLAVIGPNGAGKTTFLLTLARLLKASQGELIFKGDVQKVHDGSFILSVSGHAIEALGKVAMGEKVICCIRLEHIIISTHKVGEGTSIRNNLPGKIVKIVPQGHFFKIHLDCGFYLASYVTHQSLNNLSLNEGKSVTVSFKATAVHMIRRGNCTS